MAREGPVIERVGVTTCRFPTDEPEADGTLAWDHTDVVIVEVHAGSHVGTGWTFAPAAAARVVTDLLAPVVRDSTAVTPREVHGRMRRAVRNAGAGGLVAMAISAVDIALWDLAARVQGVCVTHLLGASSHPVAVYGSGGFTTYDDARLDTQLDEWLEWGVPAVKIKIGESWGSRTDRDLARVRHVLARVEDCGVEVFVDANGAYSVGQASRVGRALDDLGVTWLEEPVSSEDVAGLAQLRTELAADVAAGEYADGVSAAQRLVGGCVDCLQLDVTRCGGYTGFLACASVAQAHGIDVSAHGAPYLSLAVATAVPRLRHLEYFHDHVRIAHQIVDRPADPVEGMLVPSLAPGHGMTLRRDVLDAHRIA